MAQRDATKVKAHWGPEVGRVKCGARKPQRRVKTREEWSAIERDERCNLCEGHVQREDKPRGFNVQGLYGRRSTPKTREPAP